jgi:hypothetical protein
VTVTDAFALAAPDVAVTVADPSATAVTSPADETVATPVSDELHVTVGSVTALPAASLTITVRVKVSPNDVNATISGESSTVVPEVLTVTATVPFAEPEIAVIVPVPFATAVTKPDDETVAIPMSDELQVTEASDITLARASFTVAVRVVVSATDMKLSELGDSSTLEADCATVIDAVPLADPDVTVIVAAPFAIAVTRPAEDTVTTAVSDDDQVTVSPGITTPFTFTVAFSVAVSPRDAKLTELDESSTVRTEVETVTDAVAVSEPAVAVIVADPSEAAVTKPTDETVATPASDDDHVTEVPLIVAPL